jgi:hypothetical protein
MTDFTMKPFAAYLTDLKSHFDDIEDQVTNDLDKIMGSTLVWERLLVLIAHTRTEVLRLERQVNAQAKGYETASSATVQAPRVIADKKPTPPSKPNPLLKLAIAAGQPVTNVVVFTPKGVVGFGKPLKDGGVS